MLTKMLRIDCITYSCADALAPSSVPQRRTPSCSPPTVLPGAKICSCIAHYRLHSGESSHGVLLFSSCCVMDCSRRWVAVRTFMM